uniref:CCHC-type domain-containing protein n=1 Tax=Vitis vinifera TaxID=29760 RepID=A5BV24_VITVI|nr:hypothetical protein VITISV_013319 [Vitis vinifera]
MEVEYVVASKVAKEVLWLLKFLMKLRVVPWVVQPMILFCDKNNETIVEMIIRFTDIVNGLEALGKTYKKSKKERWEKKRDLVCFKCKKSVHIKYDCPLYKSEAKRRKKKTLMATWSESEDESSKEKNEKEVANICFMEIDELDEGSKKDKWFLDSGCSRHMTGGESKFAFLAKIKIKMEDMLLLETMQKERSLVKATLVMTHPLSLKVFY